MSKLTQEELDELWDDDLVTCEFCGREMNDMDYHECPNCYQPCCMNCCERLDDLHWGYCPDCFG